jgi:hypothetical protein
MGSLIDLAVYWSRIYLRINTEAINTRNDLNEALSCIKTVDYLRILLRDSRGPNGVAVKISLMG